MLTIHVPERELFDDEKQEFITTESVALKLEHSLVSIARWESKWELSFLNTKEKTDEQMASYIESMIISPEDTSGIVDRLTAEDISAINTYINASYTATTFKQDANSKKNSEVITAELIYYWMIALNIPFECQHWHINRLITLVRVCNLKNQPPKKRSTSEIAASRARLNAERRAQMGSRG